MATPTNTGIVHGPTVIPAIDPFDRTREMVPHQPGLYGRYLVIDLTANNRTSIDAWCDRNPDKPRPDFGYGVCRQGFGLQRAPKPYLTKDEAEEWAKALNSEIPKERLT